MGGIRHIAVDATSEAMFLTGEFERTVRLWSFEQRSLMAELDTVLDYGGHRLALCRSPEDDPLVVAGAWERHGICGSSPDGAVVWQRKDLKRVQHLAPAARGYSVTACFEDGPMHVLDASSGETVAKVRAVRRFAAGRFGDVGLGEVYGHAVIVDTAAWRIAQKVPFAGFASLAIADAPGAFAVADVADSLAERQGGPRSSVFALDLGGDVLWRWEAPAATNCPALAWDERASEWVGVLNHVENERPDTLVRWSVDGELCGSWPLGELDAYELLPGGRHVVTSAGEVRETTAGEVVWRLPGG